MAWHYLTLLWGPLDGEVCRTSDVCGYYSFSLLNRPGWNAVYCTAGCDDELVFAGWEQQHSPTR